MCEAVGERFGGTEDNKTKDIIFEVFQFEDCKSFECEVFIGAKVEGPPEIEGVLEVPLLTMSG